MTDKKTTLIVGIELLMAGLLVAIGNITHPDLERLYHSYFADVALPFGYYFLLMMPRLRAPVLRRWWFRAGAVFLLCAASECLQFFGIYALARTFDPVDYVMYAMGVMLAASVDRQVLARILPFWDAAPTATLEL